MKQDQGLIIALLLEYPHLGGKHTHWLAVQKQGKTHDNVLVIGDLTPFGLKSFGVSMSLEKLAESMKIVPGGMATTSLTNALSPMTQQAGLMTENNIFVHNASIYNFKQH